jgi:hypothetical protein
MCSTVCSTLCSRTRLYSRTLLGSAANFVLQTPEEQLAQFAERAQLAIWLIGSAPSIEAVALAENIYERAFEGARSFGHRLAIKPTVEGWRLVPTPLLRMKRRTG